GCEMGRGEQPERGGGRLGVGEKEVRDVVPAPSSYVPELPPSLDALVALATSRDPDLRPADAGQFLSAVEDVRGGLPIGAPRPEGPEDIVLPPVPLPAPDGVSYAGEAGPGTLARPASPAPLFSADERPPPPYPPPPPPP